MEETKQIEKEPAKKDSKKQEFIRFLKFTLFSCSAGVIQIGTFTLFSELVFHDGNNEYGLSYFISLFLSVLFNFTINRKFTFKSASNVPIAMLMVLGYYAVFTPLSILWGIALEKQAGWNKYLVLAITMVINFVTEFLFTRYVVFRKSINTQPSKKKADKKQEKQNSEKDKEKPSEIEEKSDEKITENTEKPSICGEIENE